MGNEEEMTKLLAARGRAKGRFTRKYNMLQIMMKDELSVEVIEAKRSEVEEAFVQLETLNDKVLEKVDESSPEVANHEKYITGHVYKW